MSPENLYHLVRDPDDRYERDGVQALTRDRLLELFPGTAENLMQVNNLLVRHPYLHPRFATKLLPADKLYEALREEAELELCHALIELGATEITLRHSLADTRRSRRKLKGESRVGGGSGSIEINESDQAADEAERTWKVAIHKSKLNPEQLDEQTFFNNLFYNRENETLKLLFDGIKAGKKFKDFTLEFRHSASRNYSLEGQITASYLAIFSARIDLTIEYESNNVERAIFYAKFHDLT